MGCNQTPPATAADPVAFATPRAEKAPAPRKAKKRDDAHQAALTAMLSAGFGYRTDKDRQARFPLPDRKNWTRVRFSMVEHFTGFIYGKEDHSLTLAVVVPLKETDPPTSAACVQRFEESARTQVSQMGGRLSPTENTMRKWHRKPLLIRTATGEVDILFKHYDAALAWTGYPAYPGHCMIYAVVIPWRHNRELALQLREQWIEAFKKFKPLTPTAPYRHE